jgi:2-methylcitrate dehydratase
MNTALFDLVEQHKIDPDKVKTLRIALSQPTFDLHGKLPRYKGKFDALISGHYTAAVILHDQALTLDQFEPKRYDDPKLRRAAAEQVEITVDPALTGVQAVAEVEMTDGSKICARCDHPRGSPENPLSRAQIETKLRTYGKTRLSQGPIEKVIAAVSALEQVPSARELMNLLRRTPPQAEAERSPRVASGR